MVTEYGIAGFEANVPPNNMHMLSVFYNSGYKISTKLEDNMYEVRYDIREKVKK